MFQLATHSELACKAEGQGVFFAKKGAMVAEQGQFKYSKRLLGTNPGNIVGQLVNHATRRMTGENLEIMEVNGQGTVYLADKGSHVTIITLQPQGMWQSVCVESEDLLAFTQDCHYGVTPIGVGIFSQKGLFTSKLTCNGQYAQVAIKTNGNPIVLEAPCRVDPDAIVAWTGKSPSIKLNIDKKMLIGQTSGESYVYEFNEPGQIVVVQPYEREGGISLSIDSNGQRPQTPTPNGGSNNMLQNVMDSLGGGGTGSTLGGVLGGILG